MKKILYLLIILFCSSCNKENTKKRKIVRKKEPLDSIIVLNDNNGNINCIYRFSNHKEKVLKEKISFFSNGKIDYSKSSFAEVVGNDLKFHSTYENKYKISKKRFLEFIGTVIINQSDSVQILKPDTIHFNEDSKIINYKKNLPPYGKIVETIFLDTIIKEKNKESKTIIRTIEYEIDLRDLLIYRAEKIKKNYSH
jgi:hypothetical protein